MRSVSEEFFPKAALNHFMHSLQRKLTIIMISQIFRIFYALIFISAYCCTLLNENQNIIFYRTNHPLQMLSQMLCFFCLWYIDRCVKGNMLNWCYCVFLLFLAYLFWIFFWIAVTLLVSTKCLLSLGKRRFQKRLFCNWTGGYKWSTALALR